MNWKDVLHEVPTASVYGKNGESWNSNCDDRVLKVEDGIYKIILKRDVSDEDMLKYFDIFPNCIILREED